jgi:NitT/TauT family transport system substrate-binding protein
MITRSTPLAVALVATFLVGLVAASPTLGQTRIRFALDWRIDGQVAPFFMAQAKGYFKDEGLDVQLDAGAGSALAVTRTASPAYDMGYGDMSALIEFLANNGSIPEARVQAVYIVLDATPAAAYALKKSNITKPADFIGKTFGAPVFDSGRKMFPVFARANGFDPKSVKWQSMDPPLREPMLARGQIDVATGFMPSGMISLNTLGVKDDEVQVFYFKDFGVRAYGNAILANPRLLNDNPKAIAGFLRAFNRALKETIADYPAAVKFIKAREPLVDEAVELRRLRGLYSNFVTTDNVRSGALGQINKLRLEAQVEEIVAAFGLKTSPNPDQIFNSSFLPDRADRRLP